MQTFERIDALLVQCTLPDPPYRDIERGTEAIAAATSHPIIRNYLDRATEFVRARDASKAAACLSLASAYYAE